MPQSSLQTQVNGLPRHGNLYQIEGIDDDERTGLLQIIIPPAEAIQSVDISTNNFEAELGRATGAVTNVILKSGSNSFHGSVFEFIQNNAVNARSYFAGPLGHLSYNYFGGSIGGPIWKDKLFFFGDYLRTSDHEKIANTFTIPPPRFYTDNGSPASSTSVAPTHNRTVRVRSTIQPPEMAQQRIPVLPSSTTRSPSAWSTRSRSPFLQKLGQVAQPNRNPVQPGLFEPTNNYTINLPFTKTTDSFDTKVDLAINERNHLSGRYQLPACQSPSRRPPSVLSSAARLAAAFRVPATRSPTAPAQTTATSSPQPSSPSSAFGVAHLRNSAQPSNYGSNDATTIGIPGVNIPGQPFTSGQVGITLNGGFSNPIFGYSASVPWIRAEANIDLVNNWTKVIHNHTIKFGGDVRRVRDDLLQDQTFSPRGANHLLRRPDLDALARKTNVANDMASFLLDVPSQAGRDLNTFFPAYRQWWIFAFASDKWQATSKLTLDLGVRWELYPPATPKINGGFSNYDSANNQLVLAGIGGNPSNMGMKTHYRYFAPRTGFSYRATDNTVIRGGFGISYTPFPDNNYAYNYPIRANNAYDPAGGSPSPRRCSPMESHPLPSRTASRRLFPWSFPRTASFPPTPPTLDQPEILHCATRLQESLC